MKPKEILEGLGFIDERFIEEAGTKTYKQKTDANKILKFIVPVAASFALIITSITFWQGQNAPPIPPSMGESIPPVDSSNIYDVNVFSLVAYTANTNDTILTENYMSETTITVLKPGLEIMLPNYSPVISNVPGFPFTANFTDETNGTIKISVDNGKIEEWNPETGVISEIENEGIIKSGTTFYWSPISDENALVETATITISILNDNNNNIVATQNVKILYKDFFYYATIDELVSLSVQ